MAELEHDHFLKSASAGGVIKKIVEINPDLHVNEVINIVRQSMHKQGAEYFEFAEVDVVNEALALKLARETLSHATT